MLPLLDRRGMLGLAGAGLTASLAPGAAVLWRVTLAAVLLLPVGLWVMRGRLSVVLAEWRIIVGFGALAVATAQLMYFAAVSRR